MRIIDIMNLTKDDRKITFNRVDDSEGDKNRGWQVDKLEALVDGQVAGYLKMSYIPLERFKRYYPSILNYMMQIGGNCWMDIDRRELPYQKWTDQELIDVISRSDGWPYDRGPYEKLSRKDLLMAMKAKIKRLMGTREGVQFRKFRAFHVNNPHVDFIRTEKTFQRLGIGTALYHEGARWMAEKGMKLYASSLQQPEAKAAWDKFAANGQTAKDKRGMYLVV